MSQFFINESSVTPPPITSFTADNGGTATGANINVLGQGAVSSGISTSRNLFTTASGSTLVVNETQAQFLTNYRQVGGNAPVLATDYLIGCTASNITLTLEAAPPANRILVIKDESGTATATPTTIAGNGNTINGMANLSLDQSFASFNLYFNGTSWFSY